MKYGFTTGSCAAAATKAAAYMLLIGNEKNSISIETPKGVVYNADVVDITRGEDYVKCAVIKDGGDDPDVTTGAYIYSKVTMRDGANQGVIIDGGAGVGRVTKPGLDQPVGNAAINHVPREMIEREALEVMRLADYRGLLEIEISVPDGEAIADKTFNKRLGIEGGISIIGTSGVVEPMSTKALLDTIKLELNVRRTAGYDYVAITPGNYGRDFMKSTYDYDLDRSVKCSNYIGLTLDMAKELGFKNVLLTGHIGKLVKVSGGIMNTHSSEGDSRMELIVAAGLKANVSTDALNEILECVATEEAVRLLELQNKKQETMDIIMDKIMFYLNKRAGDSLAVDCIMYSNEFGELSKSRGVDRWLTLLAQEVEQ